MATNPKVTLHRDLGTKKAGEVYTASNDAEAASLVRSGFASEIPPFKHTPVPEVDLEQQGSYGPVKDVHDMERYKDKQPRPGSTPEPPAEEEPPAEG